MKFVLDSKRSSSGKVLDGFVPEVGTAQWAKLEDLNVFVPPLVNIHVRLGSTSQKFFVQRKGDKRPNYTCTTL